MKLDNKYIIGLTGGIGCGKTMILEHLKNEYDGFVIEADKVGHSIMDYNTEGYDKVVEAFGEHIVNNEGVKPYIDRKILGQIVFNDKEKLALLNNITHPLIHKKIVGLIEDAASKLVIIEAAILLDSSLKDLCDVLWYVYAKDEVRLERLQKYRNIDNSKALQVIKNQPSEEEYRSACHIIIDNSYDKENTFEQIKINLPGGRLWEN